MFLHQWDPVFRKRLLSYIFQTNKVVSGFKFVLELQKKKLVSVFTLIFKGRKD